MSARDPEWIRRAYNDIGLTEVAGPRAATRVLEMFRLSGHAQIQDDETAWCSAAANCWMIEAGIPGTGSLAARSWLNWGRPLDHTASLPRGAVLIFRRGSGWQGHVCFLLADYGDRLRVIGGNQSNAVTVATYSRDGLIGARWPHEAAEPRPKPKPKPPQPVPPPPAPAPTPVPTPPPQPEPEPAPERKSWRKRIWEWLAGGGLASLAGFGAWFTDWRVAAVLVSGALVGFLLYWFLVRRRRRP
jgi:uncharacterized protein (TIGR02594 family)